MREWYTLEYSRYGIHTVGRYSDIEEVKSKLLEFDKAKLRKRNAMRIYMFTKQSN